MKNIFMKCSHCLRNQLLTQTLKRSLSSQQPLYEENSEILRRSRIKKTSSVPSGPDNFKTCTAYSTGESYNFENIEQYFLQPGNKYKLSALPKDATDVLHVKTATNHDDLGDVFLFRRLGAFVCWNLNETEIIQLRDVLKQYELSPYASDIIDEESEQLNFMHADQTSLVDGDIYLNTTTKECTQSLEKLAFSNSMALSVKLNMWESSLEEFSGSLRYVPEVLKRGFKVALTRNEVLQKIGELLTLRHQINLYSDLLTTPDFYWDREDLEKLYLKTCTYLEISKRTKVMNEKLNLCSELVEMLRSHLNDQHGHRLEWMIIVLIAIEILFEVIRLAERWM